MQVLEAGTNKYLLLELDPEFIGNIIRRQYLGMDDAAFVAEVVMAIQALIIEP